ncbi:hypothetical protein HYH03_015642 [Edaphochlamys debaryana]|uniref:Uncharacterized protein n=1 Tax=Edaphochlamys debaryana TaxID=47281 RepID=A0A835XLK4_9CHLO|nr:hypothetical protein HYH03_015642 [Edaphochlamys debaryana]|eukprot:KAG2485670.1 hypothetical protein HYH03_015642 [Edaphochlamys debaryana]
MGRADAIRIAGSSATSLHVRLGPRQGKRSPLRGKGLRPGGPTSPRHQPPGGKDCGPRSPLLDSGGGAAGAALAAAVAAATPALRHLGLRCPTAAAAAAADAVLAAVGGRVAAVELATDWPLPVPYAGLRACTGLQALRLQCGRGQLEAQSAEQCPPTHGAKAVPPAVAVVGGLRSLRCLELCGRGWLPQLGVLDPAVQLVPLSALSALTRLRFDLSYIFDTGTDLLRATPTPTPQPGAAAQPLLAAQQGQGKGDVMRGVEGPASGTGPTDGAQAGPSGSRAPAPPLQQQHRQSQLTTTASTTSDDLAPASNSQPPPNGQLLDLPLDLPPDLAGAAPLGPRPRVRRRGATRVITWPADEEWRMGRLLRGLRGLVVLELRSMKVPMENLAPIAALSALTRLCAGSLSCTPLRDAEAEAEAEAAVEAEAAAEAARAAGADALGAAEGAAANGGGAGAGEEARKRDGACLGPGSGLRLGLNAWPEVPLPPRLKELALERLPSIQLLAALAHHPMEPRLVLYGEDVRRQGELRLPVIASAGVSGGGAGGGGGPLPTSLWLRLPPWLPAAAAAAARLLVRDVLPWLCRRRIGAVDGCADVDVAATSAAAVSTALDNDGRCPSHPHHPSHPSHLLYHRPPRRGRRRRPRSLTDGCAAAGSATAAAAAVDGTCLERWPWRPDGPSPNASESSGSDGGGGSGSSDSGSGGEDGEEDEEPGLALTLQGTEEWVGVVAGPHAAWLEAMAPMDGYIREVSFDCFSLRVEDLRGLRRGLPSLQEISPGGGSVYNMEGFADLHSEWPVLPRFMDGGSEGWSSGNEEEAGSDDDGGMGGGAGGGLGGGEAGAVFGAPHDGLGGGVEVGMETDDEGENGGDEDDDISLPSSALEENWSDAGEEEVEQHKAGAQAGPRRPSPEPRRPSPGPAAGSSAAAAAAAAADDSIDSDDPRLARRRRREALRWGGGAAAPAADADADAVDPPGGSGGGQGRGVVRGDDCESDGGGSVSSKSRSEEMAAAAAVEEEVEVAEEMQAMEAAMAAASGDEAEGPAGESCGGGGPGSAGKGAGPGLLLDEVLGEVPAGLGVEGVVSGAGAGLTAADLEFEEAGDAGGCVGAEGVVPLGSGEGPAQVAEGGAGAEASAAEVDSFLAEP